MPHAISLSRNARELIARRLSGEEVELTEENRRDYERLAQAGFTVPGSARLTPEALKRRREFLPHDGPLSAEAVAVFREHLAGKRQADDANRIAYRELAAAGLMVAAGSPREVALPGLPQIRTCALTHTARHVRRALLDGTPSGALPAAGAGDAPGTDGIDSRRSRHHDVVVTANASRCRSPLAGNPTGQPSCP
jgi:hypothetical protein